MHVFWFCESRVDAKIKLRISDVTLAVSIILQIPGSGPGFKQARFLWDKSQVTISNRGLLLFT